MPSIHDESVAHEDAAVAPPRSTYPPPRLPLTVTSKKGAVMAGALGYSVITIGFGILFAPFVYVVVDYFYGHIADFAARPNDIFAGALIVLREFFASTGPLIPALLFLAAVLVGGAVMALGVLVSNKILAAHQIPFATKLTRGAFGRSVVVSFLVGWVPGLAVQSISAELQTQDSDVVTVLVITAIIYVIVSIATSAWIGSRMWLRRARALSPHEVATPSEGKQE